jgi:hypothetical protein
VPHSDRNDSICWFSALGQLADFLELIIETLTRFVRIHLPLTSHVPAPDEAGRAMARSATTI